MKFKTFGFFVENLLSVVNDLTSLGKLLRDLWDALLYIILSLFTLKYRLIQAVEMAKYNAIKAITERIKATKDLAYEIFPARIALAY